MSSTVEAKKIVASTKHQRISAYKVRRVANVIRGKSAQTAVAILKALPHKGAKIILKVLESAIANGSHNFGVAVQSLAITEILVNEGPHSKRFHPRARGRIYKILKRTAHISITLGSPAKIGGSK